MNINSNPLGLLRYGFIVSNYGRFQFLLGSFFAKTPSKLFFVPNYFSNTSAPKTTKHSARVNENVLCEYVFHLYFTLRNVTRAGKISNQQR